MIAKFVVLFILVLSGCIFSPYNTYRYFETNTINDTTEYWKSRKTICPDLNDKNCTLLLESSIRLDYFKLNPMCGSNLKFWIVKEDNSIKNLYYLAPGQEYKADINICLDEKVIIGFHEENQGVRCSFNYQGFR